MQGHTHTHTALKGVLLQWCEPVDGRLPDDLNKTELWPISVTDVHTHTQTQSS